jgi:hypothetical protein
VPYNQLRAQGRYTEQAIPDEFPWMFASLAASDAGFNADLLSTDGKRNLNVNVQSGVGAGGGIAQGSYNAIVSALTNVTVVDGIDATYGIGAAPALLYGVVGSAILKGLTGANVTATMSIVLAGAGGIELRLAVGIASAIGQLVPLTSLFPVPIVLGIVGGLGSPFLIRADADQGDFYVSSGALVGGA